MRILLPGNNASNIENILWESGHIAETKTGIPPAEKIKRYDFLISFGCRLILDSAVLDHFAQRAINIHISFLPYNRGADPDIWSFLKNTKKDVTIHELTPSLDAGHITLRKETVFDEEETFKTSYGKLTAEAIELFTENVEKILSLKTGKKPQESGRTCRRIKDKGTYAYLCTDKGYDTSVSALAGKALN